MDIIFPSPTHIVSFRKCPSYNYVHIIRSWVLTNRLGTWDFKFHHLNHPVISIPPLICALSSDKCVPLQRLKECDIWGTYHSRVFIITNEGCWLNWGALGLVRTSIVGLETIIFRQSKTAITIIYLFYSLRVRQRLNLKSSS